MEPLNPFNSVVAFYLSDGTTARKNLGQIMGDSVEVVQKLVRGQGLFLQVDSLDDDRAQSGEEFYIVKTHVVAFKVTP